MMRVGKTLLVAAILTVAAGCYRGSGQFLDVVEALLDERPDSALVMLENHDRRQLSGRSEEARYGLLHIKAMDKCNVFLSDLDIARDVYKYFKANGPDQYKMQALYYLGKVYSNLEDYAPAKEKILEAESYAVRLGDNHQLGLIYRLLGHINNNIYEDVSAIDNYSASAECFRLSGEENYQIYSEWLVGQMYMKIGDYDTARNMFEALVPKFSGKKYEVGIYNSLIRVYQGAPDSNPNKALSAYRTLQEIQNAELYPVTYGSLAEAFHDLGQRDSAYFYLHRGYDEAVNSWDSAAVSYYHSRILEKEGDLVNAQTMLNDVLAVQDSLIYEKKAKGLEMNSTAMQIKPIEGLARIGRLWRIVAIIFGLCMLALCVLLAVAVTRKKRLDEKLKYALEAVSQVSELKEMNLELESNLSSFMDKHISVLLSLSRQYEKMSANYHKRNDKEGIRMMREDELRYKEQLIDGFNNELRQLGSEDALLSGLEDIINKKYDNLISDVREQYANDKAIDIDKLVLFMSGLSTRTISFFTGIKEATLRSQKSRMKEQFIRQDTALSKRIVSVLS